MTVESQLTQIAASGFAPIPEAATLAHLIDKYLEGKAREGGKTKTATLAMFKRELGSVRLVNLNAVVLRDFIDQRLTMPPRVGQKSLPIRSLPVKSFGSRRLVLLSVSLMH